jgi:hypothetical protein
MNAIELHDAIEEEIRFARGLEIAIAGEAELSGFDEVPLATLAALHTDRLRAIAAKLTAKVAA